MYLIMCVLEYLVIFEEVKGNVKKASIASKWGWPFADSWQETEDLSLTVHKEINAASSKASWESGPFPVELQMRI